MESDEQHNHKAQNYPIPKQILEIVLDNVVARSLDTKTGITKDLAMKMEKLEEILKKCQEELVESNENVLVKDIKVVQLEKDIKTQANLLDIEYQLKHEEDILEKKMIKKKLEKIEKENDELKIKIDSLYGGLEKLTSNDIVNPSSEEETNDLVQSYKATQVLMRQKCLDTKKSEEMNSELSIRLELEHERRVRAQTEIGEIEKERMILQNELDSKSEECIKKSQEYEEVKLGCDYKLSKYTIEIQKLESKLEKVILEKDKRILTLQSSNAEINLKLESSKERYNNQVEVSKTLQNELQSSYVETQSLIKEMEMLNLMFAELDNHIFSGKPLASSSSSKGNGKQIQADEVLKVTQTTEPSISLLQQSCHNEVNTKYGTKMVLSVSKTFLKLKDLILEKNTMEEQMQKMKHMNDILCSQVNLHEEKLCDITDELNNTWFYVSRIKEQHKKLHSAEQILRAELAEKRKLLNNIRKELEESKASMDLVKKMNDESEKQCVQLRADFVERKRLLTSSPESGISELDSEDKSEDIDLDSGKCTPIEELEEMIVQDTLPVHVTDLYDDSDSEEIPDPFSDDEDENDEALDRLFCPVVQTFIAEIDEVEIDSEEEEDDDEPGFTPIFVPSLSYLAQVPASMQPDLFASEKNQIALNSQIQCRDRLDENVIDDEVDDNVRDLINRLSSSTSRGAFLANRLSDIHRRIATGTSLTDHNDWFDDTEEEAETEANIEIRETHDDDELSCPSPNLRSENVNNDFDLNHMTTSTPAEDIKDDVDNEFEDERPASTDSMVLAIDEAINILDPVAMGQIPLAPFLFSPQNDSDMHEDMDEERDDDENSDEAATSTHVPESSDSSADVTRFLIKHLPKQLTQLRNEKHELEDKIHDFEQVVSEQRMQMNEHERRVEVERSKTKKLEERLMKVEEKASKETKENTDIPVVFTVPVQVEQENMVLNWTVESKSERACGFWISFITQGASNSDAVIMPNAVREVIPMDVGISTSLQVDCAFKGRYTLHIQGNDARY